SVVRHQRCTIYVSSKTLTHLISEFLELNPGIASPDNAMSFLSDDGGATYNRCHCKSVFFASLMHIELLVTFDVVWSNFEIGDMDFWRSEAYSKLFEFLDQKGGFHYEVSPRSSFFFTVVTPAAHSAGATHPCTASEPHCLLGKTKFTSSTTLAIDTSH